MRWFLRRPPRPAPAASQPPEFGVRIVLRKGDKIVRRDARGEVRITRVTEERVDEREILSLTGVRGPRPHR
jgi:hypothetical protein